jgi:precorrin-2 methylase
MWKLSPLTMFTIVRPCKSLSFSVCGMMKYPVQNTEEFEVVIMIERVTDIVREAMLRQQSLAFLCWGDPISC